MDKGKSRHIDTQHIKTYASYLKSKNHSKSTIEQYSSILRVFLSSHSGEVRRITTDQIVEYISRLKSRSSMAQNAGAIKHFFCHVMGQPNKFARIPYPKKEKRLPKILSTQIVISRLRAIKNLKHRAMLSLLYSCGLRRQELLNLRISNVDSSRMVLSIKQSKGAKDRDVPISTQMIELLREYFVEYRPKDFLFNGQNGGMYSATSLGKLCHLHMKCNPHILRHSYATHLAERNLELGTLQKRLGHNDPRTTMVYHHVAMEATPLLVSI